MSGAARALEGRVAVVTGGGSGIGRTIAEAFAAEGARVAVAGRRREKLEESVAAIAAAGGTALAVPTDVANEEQVRHLFAATQAAWGRIDLLVNNAGGFAGAPTDEFPLQMWRDMIDTNLTGAFLCLREAFRIMKSQRAGRIINIGSTSAKVPRPKSAAYVASKWGLDGLTRMLAIEAREFGVAVSIIHPGNTVPGVWSGQEDKVKGEGLMDASNVARIAVLMASLPADANLYESIVLPVSMPFLGRG
ncbi:MAG: SDR family oxidoreductase [Betaproteobacteria bacterium]|nr:SDR family oxidoreductase [Betaproteobacteria bacterium]